MRIDLAGSRVLVLAVGYRTTTAVTAIPARHQEASVAESIVDDDMWDDFHRVVNMTSRELRDWLAVQGADEVTEELPDRAGSHLGHRVLDILGKRRSDVTGDDVEVMERVVARVRSQRREDLEPTAGEAAWRRRLMNVGHDPLKPA
jgi:hypothetical protein